MDNQFQLLDISRSFNSQRSIDDAQKSWSISLAILSEPVEQQNFSTEDAESDELKAFVGPCIVIDLFEAEDGSIIQSGEAEKAWKDAMANLIRSYGSHVELPKRALFRTKQYGESSEGRYFSKEALEKLFDNDEILLIGVDTPSFEPLLKQQILVADLQKERRSCLLNLDLSQASAGILYNLIAPPILLTDSKSLIPVRAVLATI